MMRNVDQERYITGLTDNYSNAVRPSWSADGKFVYFGCDRTGVWQIWKVSITGGQLQQVTKGGGREAFESVDGEYVYFTKQEGTEGIFRVPSGGGNEELVINEGDQGFWGVSTTGLAWVRRSPKPATIRQFDFRNLDSREIASIPRNLVFSTAPSFAISSDARWILFVAINNQARYHDIFLAEYP